jgi:hypothetical protein
MDWVEVEPAICGSEDLPLTISSTIEVKGEHAAPEISLTWWQVKSFVNCYDWTKLGNLL